MNDNVFQNSLDMCLPGMTPAEVIPKEKGVRGSEGVLSSVGWALALGYLEQRMG